MSVSPSEQARRINRTWLVRGGLADDAARYLEEVERRDPRLLDQICAEAVAAARLASREHRDPKPDFYACLFSHATEEERARHLQDHLWTRERSEELSKKRRAR